MITMKQVTDSLNRMEYISKVSTLKMLAYDMWNVLESDLWESIDYGNEPLSELALLDSEDVKKDYPDFNPEADYITCGSNAPINEKEVPALMLDNENKIKKATVYAVNNNLIDLEDISYLFDWWLTTSKKRYIIDS